MSNKDKFLWNENDVVVTRETSNEIQTNGVLSVDVWEQPQSLIADDGALYLPGASNDVLVPPQDD